MRNQLIDVSLSALSCVYAAWLREHKEHEPHRTYAEVIFGVGYTLAGAALKTPVEPPCGWHPFWRWACRDWHVWSAFLASAPPIVIGEIAQAREAARQDAEWNAKQQAVTYRNLLQ